ncbi:MAG: hypothetical protein HOG49_03120 [Candidatus Scalindua sp.]|jgi:hypothetical protein|nr:hypothetical protein [Candidatus Scalindua sp.]
MKKLNFDKVLVDLEGKAILEAGKEINLKQLVSNLLLQAREGDAIKLYDWAGKIYKDGLIEIDDSDIKKLTEILNKAQLPVITKAQILKVLEV